MRCDAFDDVGRNVPPVSNDFIYRKKIIYRRKMDKWNLEQI